MYIFFINQKQNEKNYNVKITKNNIMMMKQIVNWKNLSKSMKSIILQRKDKKHNEDILFNNQYPDDRSKRFINIIITIFILTSI